MSTTVITENIFGSDKPDRPLYHYTTQEGLLGIVKKREMWATHHQYLNDTQEFLHAKALFCTEIERRLNSESAGSEICLVLEEMRSAVNRSNENTSWYVASFRRMEIPCRNGVPTVVQHRDLPLASGVTNWFSPAASE